MGKCVEVKKLFPWQAKKEKKEKGIHKVDRKIEKDKIEKQFKFLNHRILNEGMDECYSTIKCKILLNQPQCEIGQHETKWYIWADPVQQYSCIRFAQSA